MASCCEQRISCLTRRCFVLIKQQKMNKMKTMETRAIYCAGVLYWGLKRTFFAVWITFSAYQDFAEHIESKAFPGISMISMDKLSKNYVALLDFEALFATLGWTSRAPNICFFTNLTLNLSMAHKNCSKPKTERFKLSPVTNAQRKNSKLILSQLHPNRDLRTK